MVILIKLFLGIALFTFSYIQIQRKRKSRTHEAFPCGNPNCKNQVSYVDYCCSDCYYTIRDELYIQ